MAREIIVEDLNSALLTPLLSVMIWSQMHTPWRKDRNAPLPANHKDMYMVWRHCIAEYDQFNDLQGWIDGYRLWYNTCRNIERFRMSEMLNIDNDLREVLHL